MGGSEEPAANQTATDRATAGAGEASEHHSQIGPDRESIVPLSTPSLGAARPGTEHSETQTQIHGKVVPSARHLGGRFRCFESWGAVGASWKVLFCCRNEKEDLYHSLEYLDTDLLLAVFLSGDLDVEYISKHVNLENAKWACGLVLLDGSEGAPEFHRGPDYHLEPSIAELRLHVGGDTHVAEMTQLLEELLIEQEGLDMGRFLVDSKLSSKYVHQNKDLPLN